jgi:peptidoglycan hydrolase-like protein with peptidoglycan-binding domain
VNRVKRRRGRVALASTAAVLVVGGGTAAVTNLGLDRGGEQPRSDAPPATAPVTRQTLTDTQSESGEPDYGTVRTASARLSGTLTWLPAAGTVLTRGQALYKVDDAPVTLLYGTLPAYRRLAVGTEGADVLEFERNLYALGYRGFTVDETYSAGTATAVREWQDDLGLPTTGVVEPGRVAFAAGAVRVDAQKAAPGDAAMPGQAVLDYTGTARVVTADLDVADQRLATKGAAVTVVLPDGRTAAGRVATVTTVVQPAQGQDPAVTKVEVTIALADQSALAGLDQATVEVHFTAASRPNVLTVPVAALLALAEGGYGVQVVDHGTTRLVGVQTGLFADGRVEVSGAGIAPGVLVGVPS